MISPRTINLTTQRLLIREWTNSATDEDALLAIESNPDVVRFLEFDARDKNTIRYSRIPAILLNSSWQPRRMYECAIELQATNRVIGVCCLWIEDEVEMRGQLSYSLHSGYWKQGYGTEAAREMLRFGFEELGLNRIYAMCDIENLASQHVLTHIGMKQDAVLSRNVKGKQREWPKYALFRDQWQALQV